VNRRVALLAAIIAVGVVALWWVFLYSPAAGELADLDDDITQVQGERQGLQAKLRQLKDIASNGPEIDAELGKLANAVPETPELASFILSANEIALESGIDWLSVAPSEPVSSGPGPATIQVTIQVQGGFFQVLDYLNRLEDLQRLVVVDSITMGTTEGQQGTDGSDAGLTSSDLTVNLSGRMFTMAEGTAAAGSTTRATPRTVSTPSTEAS
jgi:Tfp pilus assembly protein PilO